MCWPETSSQFVYLQGPGGWLAECSCKDPSRSWFVLNQDRQLDQFILFPNPVGLGVGQYNPVSAARTLRFGALLLPSLRESANYSAPCFVCRYQDRLKCLAPGAISPEFVPTCVKLRAEGSTAMLLSGLIVWSLFPAVAIAAPALSDPCAAIAGSLFSTPGDALACLRSFPFNETLRRNVLTTVSRVFDFYTFEDYYPRSSAPFPSTINIRAELARIGSTSYAVRQYNSLHPLYN